MPDKKRYQKIKKQKKAGERWRKQNLRRHEVDLISGIFHLRQDMKKHTEKVERHLRSINVTNPAFVTWALEAEMTELCNRMRFFSAMFAAHYQHDPTLESRVLKGVARWEKYDNDEE